MMTPATRIAARPPAVAISGRVPEDDDMAARPKAAIDFREKLLPDGVTLLAAFDSLTEAERHFVGRIQARTYANMFGILQRFVGADALEQSRHGRPNDRIGFEAPVASGTEGLARQVALRRMEAQLASGMPTGYRLLAGAQDVAHVLHGKSNWALRAYATAIEFFWQLHACETAASDEALSPLLGDTFLGERTGESLHATVAEMEWVLFDRALKPDQRDAAVDAFVELVEAIDQLLEAQSRADTRYFAMYSARPMDAQTLRAVAAALLKAYRWQYLLAGMHHPRFRRVLEGLLTRGQEARVRRVMKSFA